MVTTEIASHKRKVQEDVFMKAVAGGAPTDRALELSQAKSATALRRFWGTQPMTPLGTLDVAGEQVPIMYT